MVNARLLPAAMGGYMASQQRRIDDPMDPRSAGYGRRTGSGAGSLFLATLLGVGIGVLAAPQSGSKTRKLLGKRLAALGEGVGGSLEDVQEISSKARKRAKQRLAQLREGAGDEWEEVGERWQKAKSRLRDIDLGESENDSSSFGTLFAIAAGVAATYLLTSDRAAPVRSRVQGAASDVRRRATDQWDRFQRGGTRMKKEGSATTSIDDAPQAG
jgi:gas vesicle protein